MDEAAESVAAVNFVPRCCFSSFVRLGRPEFERTMGPLAAVVVNVDAEHPFEVTTDEDQQPVQTLGTYGADEAFCDRVRLRCPINWLIGARAERRIGKDLDRLVDKGWFVLHGYKREWGGDIDHVAIGPNGAFMVETKSYAFRRSDLRRAAWNAAWLKEKLEIRWVTGVLCVNEDRPPMLEGAIWVIGHDELLPWLEKQRDTPVDPDRARDVPVVRP